MLQYETLGVAEYALLGLLFRWRQLDFPVIGLAIGFYMVHSSFNKKSSRQNAIL